MNFEQKLKKQSSRETWQEYCGFLDLSMDEYMAIQERLLKEQLELLSNCALGQRFLQGKLPGSMDEFRRTIPLTTYEDYADILLLKRTDMLPAQPVVWLETTWESGLKPVKLAPYSENMLAVYRTNIIAAMILSTSDKKYCFEVHPNYRVLYGLAPLPYATGLFPDLISSEIGMRFLPPLKQARRMRFSEQSKLGFKLGLRHGIDMFFGLSSVIHRISEGFDLSSGGGKIGKISPAMLGRLLRAKYVSGRDKRPVRPCDLFRLKGFVCVGTDTELFKDDLERAWGRRPLEVMGGTEPSCIATETWSKDGLTFFPDAGFYEFIPEDEMLRNLSDPNYVPNTCLMNELTANRCYELVITVLHGGSFVRYRPGDVYRCVRISNKRDGITFPQFQYVDRVPTVIDIAGFTRMTEASILSVIHMAGLKLSGWFARKKYDEQKRPYMQMYIELPADAEKTPLACSEVLCAHLSVYFRFFDSDYADLKKMLGIDPLSVTVLPAGTMAAFEAGTGRSIRRINAPREDEDQILRLAAGRRDAPC